MCIRYLTNGFKIAVTIGKLTNVTFLKFVDRLYALVSLNSISSVILCCAEFHSLVFKKKSGIMSREQIIN